MQKTILLCLRLVKKLKKVMHKLEKNKSSSDWKGKKFVFFNIVRKMKEKNRITQ